MSFTEPFHSLRVRCYVRLYKKFSLHSSSAVKQNCSESSDVGMMIFHSERVVVSEGREVSLWVGSDQLAIIMKEET